MGVSVGGMAFGIVCYVLGASTVLLLCWWRQNKGKAGSHMQEEEASTEHPTYEDILSPRKMQRKDITTIQLEANLAYATVCSGQRT